jgi:hypothetical protein
LPRVAQTGDAFDLLVFRHRSSTRRDRCVKPADPLRSGALLSKNVMDSNTPPPTRAREQIQGQEPRSRRAVAAMNALEHGPTDQLRLSAFIRQDVEPIVAEWISFAETRAPASPGMFVRCRRVGIRRRRRRGPSASAWMPGSVSRLDGIGRSRCTGRAGSGI